MELRAGCKINLGLRVLRRRNDGFHDIETVMMPVPELFDTLTVCPAPASSLEISGLPLDCPAEKNICMRALRLMQREFGVGEAHIRLHKVIPTGAGLGGGSADAAAVLRASDVEFALGLSRTQLERLAAELGSDVPFFIRNTPQLCTGRGEVMTPVGADLADKWLVIVKPPVEVSTAEAYREVAPRERVAASMPDSGSDDISGYGTATTPACALSAAPSLPEILRSPVGEWHKLLVNDFEKSVFARHPEIGALKASLYDAGALYASMSGSGSAVFGIFDSRPTLSDSSSSLILTCIGLSNATSLALSNE